MANKGKAIAGIIGLGVAAVVAIGGISLLFNRNTMVKLENSIEQQYNSNKKSYATMVNTAKEMVQVTDMYAEDFEKIYSDLISGRNQDTGLLVKLVQENNPNLDSKVYLNLQDQISANRKVFDNQQDKLLDRVREYNEFVEIHFIASSVLNKTKIDSSELIVTSTAAENAFNTGIGDPINLRDDK